MSAFNRVGLVILLALFSAGAYAQDAPVDSMIVSAITGAAQNMTQQLEGQSIRWLSGFLMLQFLITNYKLLPQAELDTVMAKFVGSMIWFGVCWYIMGAGAGLIHGVGYQMLNTYNPGFPSASGIIATSVGVATGLATVAFVGGTVDTTLGMAFLYLAIALAAIGIFFAAKIYLLELELALVVMLSPLSFSLLGLNALRDQGIAPFKSLLSLVYRIVIYGVIFAAYNDLATQFVPLVSKYSKMGMGFLDLVSNAGTVIKALFSIVFGYVLLAILLFKADSIASSLASGSTNLGTADVAGAAMAGAAAGSMLGKMTDLASKPAQGMSDWLNKLGGQTSMRNSSGMGDADVSGAPPKPDAAPTSSSLADTAKGPAIDSGAGGGGVGDAPPPPAPGGTSGGDYGGTPNQPPGDAGREARRQERMGSGANAGIQGGGLEKKLGDLVDSLNSPKGRSIGDHARDWHQQVEKEKASTHISVNTHHE